MPGRVGGDRLAAVLELYSPWGMPCARDECFIPLNQRRRLSLQSRVPLGERLCKDLSGRPQSGE